MRQQYWGQQMQISLYYFPISCALIPYIALTEANADFDVWTLNYANKEHLAPEYLRLNPKHKVPLLLVDGEPLTENIAILQWIARTFPDARLLPHGNDEFQAISLMAWCASGIHPFLTPNILPQRYCDIPGSEESVRRCAQKMLHENFRIAEDRLDQKEWFFDHFTITDVYFFWCFRRAKQFAIDVSAYSNCNAHFDRVTHRTSVQKLLAFEAAALASDSVPS